MPELWIRLDDLPAEGRDFTFPDQTFWTENFVAFNLGLQAGKELVATAHVMRQEEGALIRGHLSGSVLIACDRCAEPYELDVDVSFDEYESKDAEAEGEERRIVSDKGVLTLNMGEVLWEQLMLTLPMKPLCDKGCKGICPQCGTNLNQGQCTCVKDEGDSRLAVLRGLKVK